MKMAELSAETGVAVATVKYYIREGLLPPGERTSVNQAQYGEAHVKRIRLIRALTEIAELPISEVRRVVEALDEGRSAPEALGAAQDALTSRYREGRGEERGDRLLAELVTRRGWQIMAESPTRTMAAEALAAVDEAGLLGIKEHLDDYAAAAENVARTDLETIEEFQEREDLVYGAAIGTVLRRPLLDALIMLAQQHETIRRGFAG